MDRSNNVDILKQNGEIKSASIKDICVNKKIYKLNVIDRQYDSLYLEKFFDNFFESNYDSIYKKLIKSQSMSISGKEKIEIIGWYTQLFYRNKAYYQKLSQKYLEPIANMDLFMAQIAAKDLYDEFIESIQITKREIEKLTKNLFHSTLLKSSFILLTHLLRHDIIIVEAKGESGFLTCDNPVDVRLEISANDNSETYYLQVPLDEKHLLLLHPSNRNNNYNKIQWIIGDEITVGAANLNCHRNSDEYLIGKRNNIEKYFEFYEEFENC